MPLCNLPERLLPLESILGQLSLARREVFDGEPQIVRVLHHRQHFFGLLQADLPVGRRALAALDPLVHGVHHRPCEVGFRIRQATLIVRARSLGQSQESLALQVRDQHTLLPRRAGLDEELRQHRRQGHVLNDQSLSFL